MKVQVMSNHMKHCLQSHCCNGDHQTEINEQNFLKTKLHQEEQAHDDDDDDEPDILSRDKCSPKLQTKVLAHDDDVDNAQSVSSDSILEAESSDLHLKAQEGRLYSLSLNVERKCANASTRQQHSASSSRMVMPSTIIQLPVEVGCSSAQMSQVLENLSLPLLYIPTTRQLVTAAAAATSPDSHTNMLDLSYSSTLDMSTTQHPLHSPHSPLHKAHSVQEFHYLSGYRESDRLTVRSVDSYPGNESVSHTFADNSSLSSVSTDLSVSAISATETDWTADCKSLCHEASEAEPGFVDVSLHTRNSFDKGYNSSSLDSGFSDRRLPPLIQATRKKSFTGLKNLFTRKVKESPPGWKLFGRIPPKPVSQRMAQEISSDFQAHNRKIDRPSFPSTHKKQGAEVMSTTALILESRPVNLPSKKPEESEKHRQEYEEMVEAAKRKEAKDFKLKKKQLEQQRKYEDQMMVASQVWDTEILPHWESMRNTKRARDLWWMGLPPNVRGRVWQLAIGNDLNITHALYNICHERAEEKIKFVEEESVTSSEGVHQEDSNKESSVQVIKLDVSRTFPHLCIFQKGGPLYDLLHNLLGAYACYRPDVGYVQGMSFIAAILLLNMDVADAFVCFANLLNRPCQLAFFRMDQNMMMAYYRSFEEFLKDNLPKLYAHFILLGITSNLYLMEWVFLIYSKSLPLDVACRVWDVYFRDGEEFLFRTALAILKIHESVLLKMDFIHAAQFLTKLPEDVICEQLFKEMESVKMTIEKRGFHAVFRDLHPTGS